MTQARRLSRKLVSELQSNRPVSLSDAGIKKYRQIAGVLVRHGGRGLLFGSHPGEDADHPIEDHIQGDPQKLAQELEALGPTFIKLGQLLSTRSDLLPTKYLDALAQLQDDVEPIPFKDVRRIIREEFGKPLSRVFKSFEPAPIAAASLAQVHRARLPNGREVAVKVQRPDVRAQVTEDLAALNVIADLLDKHTVTGSKYEFQRMLEEFRKVLVAELDFEREAQNMEVLRRNLSSFDLIAIPEPLDSHTTARVLTMEFLDGRKVTESKESNPDLADALFSAYLQQILIDGLFHADPHPGNVAITRDGRLALLDLGMVGRLSPQMQEELLKLMLAAADGEPREAADVIIRFSEAREGFDEQTFQREITDLILRYRDASLKQIPVGRVVLEMSRIAVDSGLRVAPELTLLAKTLLNLDEIARVLDPDFDPNDALRRNAARLIQRRLVGALSPANVFTSVLETKDFVQSLPARANRIFDALARNELRFKVEMIDEGAVIEGLQKVANRITLGLVLAALILGAALLMQINTSFKILGYPGLAILFFLAAAGGGLWLAFVILSSDRSGTPRLPWKRVH